MTYKIVGKGPMHFSQFLIDCLMGCAEINTCVYNDSLKVIVSIQMVPHNIKKKKGVIDYV